MSTFVTSDRIAVQQAFLNLYDLRAAHSSLLKRHREGRAPVEMREDIVKFVIQARATGALLDADTQREAAQGLIDYWATTLVRASLDVPETTLADFDSSLAPMLPDDLCPYVGLQAFQEQDSKRFFGRLRMINAVHELLAGHRLVAVFGPSGSGKSSVVLGGVVPMLKGVEASAAWSYAGPIVPGSDPLGTLEAELADIRLDEKPLVLVVDQFEELFTLCEDEAARNAFANRLIELATAPGPRHIVLLTMRSDYEMYLSKLPKLQELIEQAAVRATPLNAAELREAIEKPAEQVGLKLEQGLVDLLVRDVLGEPAALPLLQFTLFRLWQDRDRNRLTLAAYRRLGGGRVALARCADGLYDNLIPQDQITMRRILMRMVRPGSGATEITSSRMRRSALLQIGDDPERVARVLQKLIDARLVRACGSEAGRDEQVEIAHEALVRNWPRLVEWLDHVRAEMGERRRLEALADEWLRYDRRSGFLDEAQLEEAERWLQSDEAKELGVKETVPALVKASRELIESRVQRERQRRTIAVGGLTLLVIVTIIALALAFERQRFANADLRKALDEKRQLVAQLQQEKEAAQKASEEAQRQASLASKAAALAAMQSHRAEQQQKLAEQRLRDFQNAQTQIAQQNKDAESLIRAFSSASYGVKRPTMAPPPQRTWQALERPVRAGASISSGNVSGTLCCLVTDGSTTYGLTLGFVAEKAGNAVVQPSFQHGGTPKDQIGNVARIDEKDKLHSGALIKLQVPAVNELPQRRGPLSPLQRPLAPGEEVCMYGSGSGLQCGRITAINATLKGGGDDQILASLHAQPGDSGAPVVTAKNELIGMLWGSSESTAVIVPLNDILQKLGVKLAPK
jgi:S1-C subfamily serine protease